MSGSPHDEHILEFARAELGPASERLLRQPAVREAVAVRLKQGRELPDAVLAELHARLADSPRLADEFAAYFLFDLMKMGKLSMSSSSRLRRFLDTGDLVLSVFGDLWTDLSGIQFESTGHFKKLFAQRLQWKAADEARRLSSAGRREDRRVDEPPEAFDEGGEGQTPLPAAIQSEERERLILILLRMKERERRLLSLHLKGESIAAIATALGLSYEATRKALSRAVDQARRLASVSDQRRALNHN